MALKVPDRTRETCTGSGTGSLVLAGSPPTNFRALSVKLVDGDEFPGVVVHRTAAEWQSGKWQYTAGSPGSIALTEFYDSSTGSQVSFSAGVKDVVVGFVGKQLEEIMSGPVLSLVPTLSTAGAYADGDVLFAPTEIPLAFPSLGGRLDLLSVSVLDEGAIGLAFDLVFFTETVSMGSLLDPVSISDADARKRTGGPVRIAALDYVALGSGSKLAGVGGLGIALQAAANSKSLWVAGIARGAGTFASTSALRFELGFS
jgi:hypothetical protein